MRRVRCTDGLCVNRFYGGRAVTVKVLVPISGGKDSQACLKLAVQKHGADNVRGLFCDTQFEHPLTYQHVEKLRTLYGPLQIDTVTGGSVLEKCEKYGRFPGGGARFCTEELKIWVTRDYCARLAAYNGANFEVWYGMRSDESPERNKRYAGKVCDELYAPHEVLPGKYPKYLARMGVLFRLAILHWTTPEVFDFLEGQHNPLYNPREDGEEGFDRVGCFPCAASGDANKEKAFKYDDFGRQQAAKVAIVSAKIGKSIWTSKGGKARNEVCALVCGD